MTLAVAVARVRYLLQEPVAKMWADTEIGYWLNDGQKAMCVRRGIEEIWTDTLVAEYSAVVTTDFYTIYKVTFAETGETAETLDPTAYSYFHNTVTFIPAEAKTGDLEVWGVRGPALAAGSTEFELPERYMDGPINYAMKQANLREENYTEAQIYSQLFEQNRFDWETSARIAKSSMKNVWL
jgi:hypothetical protein